MGNNNDFKVDFNKTINGQNSIIDDEGELLEYDNSLDKPGTQIGDVNFNNMGNSPKDMPLYGKKSKLADK